MKYRVTKNAKVSSGGFIVELEKASQNDLKKLFNKGIKGIEKVAEEASEEPLKAKAMSKSKSKKENTPKED